ncbi:MULTISPECIES: hypothetical protein [unclassified Thioalkalivibrio]|uniref:hypothetical protein n=1 Tax=unclassified Thioalkalivibrio TaxID=2621013 RepID=UPI00037DE4DE|nr:MULTISPECIES: hypothetical protein [unclassified Thioalkalivibrio]
MSKDQQALELQAAGVTGPGEPWWESFFPDDLPTDWQLEYYTHYHSRLLLPASVWSAQDEGPFGPWAEAVPAKLQLTLEWPRDLPPEAGAAALARIENELGDTLHGVALGVMGAEDAAAVEAALKGGNVKTALLAGPAEAHKLPGTREALWYPGQDGAGLWQIEPETGLDPMGWRALVEALIAAGGQGPTPVFLRARPDRLSEFRTIAQLLGVG